MGTSHAEGEALRRLREFVAHLWDECHDGGDFERTADAQKLDTLLAPLYGPVDGLMCATHGEFAARCETCPFCLQERSLKRLAGPVDASGEPEIDLDPFKARLKCDCIRHAFDAGAVTCACGTFDVALAGQLRAAAVPSSPAQEQLRETVDAFLTVLKCSDGLEGAFDAAVEKMTVALRRDVLSDRAIWSGFEPPTTAGADPASLYRTELPNKRTDDASAIIAGPQVRERVDRNTGAEMIALKAAYIEGFHAARETDGNSAFEAWLHSAAKLSAFPPSSPWLPIESAPKDGSRILAKDNYDDETVVFWSHGRNEWRLNIGGFHEDTQHDFTYWMPLHTAAALPPSSPVADSPTLKDVRTVLRQFEMRAYRADALPPGNHSPKPTLTEWREMAQWLYNTLRRVFPTLAASEK